MSATRIWPPPIGAQKGKRGRKDRSGAGNRGRIARTVIIGRPWILVSHMDEMVASRAPSQDVGPEPHRTKARAVTVRLRTLMAIVDYILPDVERASPAAAERLTEARAVLQAEADIAALSEPKEGA